MGSAAHPLTWTAARLAVGLVATLAATLAACAAPPAPLPLPLPAQEGIGYRDSRFAEVEAMRAYRTCREEGLGLDRKARAAGEPARYLMVARILEQCEADLGPAAAHLDLEDRMRAYAVAVQSRLKGGDIAGARDGLWRFAEAFAGRDLFFDDGASFIDSLSVILDAQTGNARANVPRRLAEELARLERWGR